MTTVDIVNIALIKIGVSKGITSLAESSQEAWTGELLYDHRLRLALRRFPWPFATAYAALYQTQGPVPSSSSLVQAWDAAVTYAVGDVVTLGSTRYYASAASLNHTPPNASYWTTTATEEANLDWPFAYRWPSDCLFVRRVLPNSGIGRAHDPAPPRWRVGRDVNGLLIYATQPDAQIEYTVIDCDNLWASDDWLDWFTWELAAAMAPSLSKVDGMEKKALAMAELTYGTATAVASREQQAEKPGDADWIGAR